MRWAEYERLAAHEAGHASAAIVLNIPVRSAQIHSQGGVVWLEWGFDDEDPIAWCRRWCVMTLAGPLGDGREAPRWPLRDSDPAPQDEQDLAEWTALMRFNESDYKELVDDAEALFVDKGFRRLHYILEEELLKRPVLGSDRIETIRAVVDAVLLDDRIDELEQRVEELTKRREEAAPCPA